MALTTIVKAIITADATQMKAGLAKAEKSLGAFGQKATKAGKTMTKGVTLPMALAAGAAVKSAVGFESSMTKIQSLVGLSADAVEGFTKDVKGLAGETARAPKELADAMFFVTSAGLRGAEATDVLAASAKAAAVGLGDTATIADLATSALNAYGSDVISATGATDVMVAAVREGKLEADELAGSMGRVLPVASSMGVSFNEVGAAFASMSRTGTNANEAATQLRSIMVSLLKPTKQAEDALAGMGLSSEQLRTQMREEGLLSTLQTLSTEFDGNADAAASVFGNVRALVGVMDLMGANAATTATIFGNMADVTGTLDTAFGVASDTAEFKLNAAMADVKLAFVEIGEKLIPILVPAIQKLAGWIKDLADKFSNLSPFMQKTVMILGGLLAAAGPVLLIVGKLALALELLLPKFAMLGTAISGTTVAAAALVAIPLFFWWKNVSEEAAKAKERQEKLTASFVAADDPASTLVARVEKLNEQYLALQDSTEEATEAVESFIGENVLMEELINRKVGTAFQDLTLDTELLNEALASGTNEFEALENMMDDTWRTDKQLIEALREQEGAVGHVTNALADNFEAGKLTRSELEKILDSLDETADAHDDHAESLASDAEAAIKNAEAQQLWIDAIGPNAVRIIEQATTGQISYQEALEMIEASMERANRAEEWRAEKIAETTAATELQNEREMERWKNTYARDIPALEDLAEAEREAEEAALDQAEAIAEMEANFKEMVDTVRSVIDETFGVRQAFDNVSEGMRDFNDHAIALVSEGMNLAEVFDEDSRAGAQLRDEMDKVAQTIPDLIAEMMLSKEPAEDIARAFVDQKDALFELFESWNLTPEQIQPYLDALNLIPEEVNTTLRFHIEMMDLYGVAGVEASQLAGIIADTGIGNIAGFHGGGGVFGGFSQAEIAGMISTTAEQQLAFGASGAIVKQPVLSLIGEAGPEAVVPLNQMPGASPIGGIGGNTTVVNVTVQGSVLSEMDLTDAIQAQLIRTKNRNASLEFA